MATTTAVDDPGIRARISRRSIALPSSAGLLATVLVAALFCWALWAATAQTVTVQVDGVRMQVNTHRRTVRMLLLDLGLMLHANDRVSPSLDERLRRVQRVAVQRAQPVQIVSDGRTLQTASFGRTAQEVLLDAQVAVDPYDQVFVEGIPYKLDEPLPIVKPVESPKRFFPEHSWLQSQPRTLQLRIVRALPITVHFFESVRCQRCAGAQRDNDGGLPFVIRSTAPTVGEALREAQITIYLGDRVDPSLGSEVVTGLRVTIQRSKPASVVVDGRTIRTRTRGATVADALTEMKIGVSGMDRVEPGQDTALYEGVKIGVVRVHEDIEIEEEIAPFDTIFVADPNLPIDEQQMVNPGAEGITRTRSRVRYEDGQEISRLIEDTWVAQEPDERVIAYGQRIDPKVFSAPDGSQLTYWRHIRMLATSYSANTAGVSPDKAYYGRTFTGDVMRHGIVAVDPNVVPLRSKVFVVGYGMGDALDTGSAIRARRIDLGYDDGNLVLWNRWVDVYLLWPPPAASQITWVLPNWPPVPN
jgi:uncharacterized protein YabE (DUF348 family)